MSFPRYEKYKDSGVEWLGEVPAHWVQTCIKRLATLQRGHDLTDAERTEGIHPVITSGGVSGTHGTYMVTGPGVVTGRYGSTGRLFFIEEHYWPHNTTLYVSNFHGNNPRYVWYSLHTVDFSAHSAKSAVPGIDRNDIHPLPVVVPTYAEQCDIVNFLDHETAKIGALVEEQKRVIELLKEKRRALISHVLTKGLNPNGPMKDSGVEWLGEVPAHWRVGAIKYFMIQRPGAIKTGPFGSQLTSVEMQAGEIKVYNQRSVIDNDFASGESFISSEKFSQLQSFETFPGDLLVTTRGTIGRCAILPNGVERGILHPCLLRLQIDGAQMITAFVESLIQDSELVRNQLSFMSNATTIEVIYSDTIASVVIPAPPLIEQEAILSFIQCESVKLDHLIEAAATAVDLLQERRTALISAAVTGKIDVRKSFNQ